MIIHRALVSRGLEHVAAREIRALGGGVGKTNQDRSSVTFEGPADAYLRANLHLRTVDRILVRLGTVEARFEQELVDAISAAQWEAWIRKGSTVAVSVSVRGCRLFHTGLLESLVRRALVSRGLGDGYVLEESKQAQGRDHVQPESKATIDLRGTNNRWEFSIDTSGSSLHRRGYRRAAAKAPLRETIASAVLTAAGWSGDRAFLDPMCGAGTLVMEAGWMAANHAPGLSRAFAFEEFPSLDRPRWATLQEAARARLDWTQLPALEGSDKTAGAIRAARSNAKRADLTPHTRWVCRDLADLPQADGSGLIVANPPYGKRTKAEDAGPGSEKERVAWARWGDTIRAKRPGWAAWVLAPHPDLASAAGAQGRPVLTVHHGGIPVGLHRLA